MAGAVEPSSVAEDRKGLLEIPLLIGAALGTTLLPLIWLATAFSARRTIPCFACRLRLTCWRGWWDSCCSTKVEVFICSDRTGCACGSMTGNVPRPLEQERVATGRVKAVEQKATAFRRRSRKGWSMPACSLVAPKPLCEGGCSACRWMRSART